MVKKELREAESDLAAARESLRAQDDKWATIQAYYSIFHAARALLYTKGYDERGHRALLAAVRVLYSKEVSTELLDAFEDAIGLREAADYGSVYSGEGAGAVAETAGEFLAVAKRVMGKSLSDLRGAFKSQERLVREGIRELDREHRKEARH